MITVQTIEEVRRHVAKARGQGKAIGFVPTMGALHAGHASLIDAAAAACDFVVVSIFVNPTQFGPSEDLAAYPRTPEQDERLCQVHGAAMVFAPTPEIMYGQGGLTAVSVKALAGTLCGASRPGHFEGVCTVVAKLFNIVLPDKAFFGAKDFQQAAIIQRMVHDLNFPVEVVVCPTVREPDGLAMSSRNRYLSAEERKQAPALHQALEAGREMLLRGRPPGEVLAAIRDQLAAGAAGGAIDYVRIVDPASLCDVESTNCKVLIALAVKFRRARLIDNILVDPSAGRA
jgi:pantoate--beta-alanine ligase